MFFKKEKYQQSSQSSIKDTCEIPAEVKVVMDTIGKELHEKVKKLVESVNQIWIQRVENLERERDQLKVFTQFYCQHWQNYQNLQNHNNGISKGLNEKLILNDNFSSLPRPPPPPVPPHRQNVAAFQSPHHPYVAGFQPPPPPPPPHPARAAAFRQMAPPQYPNQSTFSTPQPYQPNFSARQTLPNTSGYGFQGKQSLGRGNGYWNKDDYDEEDDDDDGGDDFSDEYSVSDGLI